MEFAFVLGVKTAGGFISQDDCRVIHQGAGYGYALFLTAGKFSGLVMGAVGKAHKGQEFLSTVLCLPIAFACNIGGNHNVFQRCKLRQQLVKLENEAYVVVAEIGECFLREGSCVDVIDTNGTAIGFVEGPDDLQECRFTGSGGTDDTDDLSFFNVERDAFQHL